MSQPFQPGDVVVCVTNEGTVLNDWVPQPRSHYRVSRIGDAVDQATGLDAVAVGLAEDPRGLEYGWPVDWFRKIDDEVTEEFREVLRKLPASSPSERVGAGRG